MKIIQIVSLIAVLALTSCGGTATNKAEEAKVGTAEKTSTEANAVSLEDKIEVIDFFMVHTDV